MTTHDLMRPSAGGASVAPMKPDGAAARLALGRLGRGDAVNTTKGSSVALWKAIKEAEIQDDVDEVLAMSDAELDAFISAHGGDPAKLRADGEALAKELDARRDRLAWHDEMDKKLGGGCAPPRARSSPATS